MTYVVITPARNEGNYLARTIESMINQSVLPALWVIVDDGSSDNTKEIADAAAAKHPWIKAVHRMDRGSRQAGSGVIEAFNDGYKLISKLDWSYVAKFDGDLAFSPDYFEKCLQAFGANEKLGIAGGMCCIEKDGRIMPESPDDPSFHVRGPTKIYRRQCFSDIGRLLVAPGWDTVDEVKARMLGWHTETLRSIRLIHLRATGAAYGRWNDLVKLGLANYVTGYSPLFMACKCIRRGFRKPYALQGIGLWAGFMKGYLKRIPQVQDPDMIRYLRRQQWRALTLRSNLWY